MHISPDGRSLLISPDRDGGVVCLNHALCASGLKRVRGTGVLRPEARYSEELGGVLVRLRRCRLWRTFYREAAVHEWSEAFVSSDHR